MLYRYFAKNATSKESKKGKGPAKAVAQKRAADGVGSDRQREIDLGGAKKRREESTGDGDDDEDDRSQAGPSAPNKRSKGYLRDSRLTDRCASELRTLRGKKPWAFNQGERLVTEIRRTDAWLQRKLVHDTLAYKAETEPEQVQKLERELGKSFRRLSMLRDWTKEAIATVQRAERDDAATNELEKLTERVRLLYEQPVEPLLLKDVAEQVES